MLNTVKKLQATNEKFITKLMAVIMLFLCCADVMWRQFS